MTKRKTLDSAARGYMKACDQTSGLLNSDIDEVIFDFHRLNTLEARKAFAHKWIQVVSKRMDSTWPVLYELLRIVKNNKLFEVEKGTGRKRKYNSFQEYFEDQVKAPFSTWFELEETYQIVIDAAPDLFAQTYEVVRSKIPELKARVVKAAKEASPDTSVGRPRDDTTVFEVQSAIEHLQAANEKVTQQRVADMVGVSQQRVSAVTTKLPNSVNLVVTAETDVGLTQSARAKLNGVSRDTQRKLDYLARHRGDLLDLVKAGEMSANGAYKEARGIKNPTPLDNLKRCWGKASRQEKEAFLGWIEHQAALCTRAGE